MLECYNEEYRDLLGKGPPAGKKHSVRHDIVFHSLRRSHFGHTAVIPHQFVL